MAVLSREKFFELIKAKVGEDTSDETIQFLEDITDTYNDLTNKKSGTEDWEKKYKENDAMWREKYRSRFFGDGQENDPVPVPEEPKKDPETEKAESIKIDDLFATNDKE